MAMTYGEAAAPGFPSLKAPISLYHGVRSQRMSYMQFVHWGFVLCVVERYVDAHGERTEHEESGETIEHSVISAWHDFSRVLGLSSGHGNVVGSGDGEGGLDQALEEAEETAELAFVVEFCEGSRVLVRCQCLSPRSLGR
jgi:hypothetical protein